MDIHCNGTTRRKNTFGSTRYLVRTTSPAAIVGRGVHERATEVGKMIEVAIHASVGPTGPIAREIEQDGACFIGRTPLPRASSPKSRYYVLTRTDVATYQSWPSCVAGQIMTSAKWTGAPAAHAPFLFTQGRLTSTDNQHTVFLPPSLLWFVLSSYTISTCRCMKPPVESSVWPATG